MEQLKVIGIEEGVLVVATETGERFALAVDETLRSQLRRVQRDAEPRTPRPSPRDIQAHIRSGLSAQEVADLLGARLEDVQRYERPMLAELADAGATGERWTSWREESGWIVKLEFTASEVDHDARWSFDPRRSTLSPQNADATQLSRQGSLPEGLIPRLRALDVSPVKDSSRFDSGAFGPRRLEPDAEIVSRDIRPTVTAAVQEAAIKRAPDQSVTSAETADLLEALRRRRGLREPMPTEQAATPATPSAPAHGGAALFDALEPGYDESARAEEDDDTLDDTVISEASRRKGRTSMPSWDEIVFGARTEDGS